MFLGALGKLSGLVLSPFNAGRMVGGAMWKLILGDGSEVLYALDWCHKKER
jgi:Cft2 family RNA processing exonuclease